MMNRSLLPLGILALGLTAAPSLAQATRPESSQDREHRRDARHERRERDVDPRWLDRLDKIDRYFLDTLIGFAPPAFTANLEWHGRKPMTWNDLRGKVVVVQSWTCRTSAGRREPLRIKRVLDRFDAKDVQILLLHTPQGLDRLERFLEKQEFESPLIIDREGEFCDALGVYKDPVNIVIGRNGAVRYAGLNTRGLGEAVELLVAEAYKPNAIPPERSVSVPEPITFPPKTGKIELARDARGEQAPSFYVQQWWNGTPNMRGKIVVVEFFAGWCPQCRASIPHLNALADDFRTDVVIIGVTDERKRQFEEEMIDESIEKSDFRYAVAIDTSTQMKQWFEVKGIPHAAVVSSDGIVRWQGHPQSLSAGILRQIVQADRGPDPSNDPEALRQRWAREKANESR
jgi:peroxiredoxin